MLKVSIGRIVLIVNVKLGTHKTLPAIVVMVHDNADQAVDVQVFFADDSGRTFQSNVRHESAADVDPVQDIFWIWPPRES